MTPTLHKEKPSSSRSRIIVHLLKEGKTVDQLAALLGITTNAVRAQIALLEREGIIEVRGEVKGSRRPAAVYGIREGADVQFSKAYPLVLSQLVKSLSASMPEKQLGTLMKDVGKGLADSLPRPSGNARDRVEGAVKVLDTLGAPVEVIEQDGKVVISGHGCVIARAVEAHVSSCKAMESFLSRLTGLPVKERCDHGARPSCRFEITLAAGKRSAL